MSKSGSENCIPLLNFSVRESTFWVNIFQQRSHRAAGFLKISLSSLGKPPASSFSHYPSYFSHACATWLRFLRRDRPAACNTTILQHRRRREWNPMSVIELVRPSGWEREWARATRTSVKLAGGMGRWSAEYRSEEETRGNRECRVFQRDLRIVGEH